MALGAEAFTILAVIEARNRASAAIAEANGDLRELGGTAAATADAVTVAGDKIEEGLGRAAPGAAEMAAATREFAAAAPGAAAGADLVAGAADKGAGSFKLYTDAAGRARLANGQFASSADKAAAASEGAAAKQSAASDAGGLSLAKVGKVAGITAIGLGIAAGVMVKAAGNFQDSTAHLQTDAGVTAQNLGMIRANILQVSSATGQSASDITNAMYHIASSGFTGANSLGILRAAAEGARVGGADLDTTSKALVGTMVAYNGTQLTAGQATKASTSLMNQLIETVGVGDMRMQDLASSLSTVTPVAAAAGVSFAQVGGAIATMTAQGMTARQATQDLANTIRNLKSPNNVASQEMRALGLNANTVSQNLGKKGLAGTLGELRNAVLSNTSGGSVMLGYLKEMSPAAQGLANQILAGTISTKGLRTAVYSLNPQQAKLISLFDNAATSATGLKQTYTGAMSKMLGGSAGLNTALMLTGKHMTDLQANTAKIAAEGKKASGTIDNWSTIQGTFNFKVAQAKTSLVNTGIAIGSALLPAVSSLFSGISKILVPVAEWTSKHQKLTGLLFISVTALAALVAVVALTAKAFKTVSGAVNDVKSAVDGATKLLKKLGLISKETSLAQAKDAKAAAAAQKKASADSAAAAKTSAGEQEAASGEAAATAETDAAETAAANERGAAESSGSWIAAAARQVAAGAVWVAQGIGKVAVIVAENVAGAAVTAAAWVVANAVMLLGIGLLVAAVIVAVVLIVKNWKRISDAAKIVFHDVLAVIDSVINWVKSHWPLLLAILTGPIGLAVLMIKDHFRQVKDAALDVVHFIEHSFESLLNLDKTLTQAGIKLVMGLVHGIESVAMAPVHAVEGIVSSVRNLLPFSPAKKGPLSGGGSPDIAGAKFATMFAGGISRAAGAATTAAHLMAAGVSRQVAAAGTAGTGSSLALSAIGPAGGGGGGNTYVTIDVHDNHVMSDSDINVLANKAGAAVVRQLGQAGVKVRMG